MSYGKEDILTTFNRWNLTVQPRTFNFIRLFSAKERPHARISAMGGPVQLEYGRPRKRRRWLAPVLVLIALIPAWFISEYFELRAKGTRTWSLWQVVRAQDRFIASAPQVGQLLFTTDPDDTPPDFQSNFCYSGPLSEWNHDCPYRGRSRQCSGLPDYLSLNNAIRPWPSTAVRFWSANSIPIARSDCIVGLRKKRDEQGQSLIQAVVLRWRHPMTVELEICEYSAATLSDPASHGRGNSSLAIPTCVIQLSEIPASIRKGALHDTENGVVAVDVSQSGVSTHVEVICVGDTYEARCNDAPVRDTKSVTIAPKRVDHPRLALPSTGVEVGRLTRPMLYVACNRNVAVVTESNGQNISGIDLEERTCRSGKLPYSKHESVSNPIERLGKLQFDRLVTLPSDFSLANPGVEAPLVLFVDQVYYEKLAVNRDRTRWLKTLTRGRGPSLLCMDGKANQIWSVNKADIGFMAFGSKTAVITATSEDVGWMVIIDVMTGKRIKEIAGPYAGNEISVTPDDQLAVLGNGAIVDLSSGRFVPTYPNTKTRHVVLSPDGRWAVLSNPDLAVVDLQDRQKPIVYEMPPHSKDKTIITVDAAFTPNGQVVWLGTDSQDSIVRLYTLDVPTLTYTKPK